MSAYFRRAAAPSGVRIGTLSFARPSRRHSNFSSFQRQLINFGFNKQHKSASLLNTVYVRVKGEPLAGVDVSELVHLRPVLKRSPPKK